MNAREPLQDHGRGHDRQGREEAGRVCPRLRQPSRAGIAEDARSRQVRLLALPPGQWPRHHQHRKGARQLRALAVAAVSQTECRSRLPDLPRRRHACWQSAMWAATHHRTAKILFRQRGCMGCHRYEGYDKEPEDLTLDRQQIKQFEQQKIDNSKQSADLMKQADAASSNDEANRLNQQAVALRVANSKIDGRMQQLDFQIAQPDAGHEEDRAEPERRPAQAEQELDSGLAEEADRFPSDHEDAELPPDRSSDSGDLGVHLAIGIHRRSAQAEARQRGARQGTVRNPRLPGLPLHRRRRSDAGRNVRRQSDPRRREGQLRLPGPLDSQRARAHASLLSVREEGHRPRGLRQEGPALPVRSAAQPVPQRRSRTASAEHDRDAEPAPERRRTRRTSPPI